MKPLNEDEMFEPVLADIKSGAIRTTHHLRLVLENLSEQSNIKTLQMLIMFREWLARRNIDLSTENGQVTISIMGS